MQPTHMSFKDLVPTKRSAIGFTLIETMIVVALLAILAAISVSAYTSQTKKAYRAEAKSALTQLAAVLERVRTENNCYCTDLNDPAGSTPPIGNVAGSVFPNQAPIQSNNPQYTLAITDHDINTFTLTATPIAGTRMEGDGIYTLFSTGATQYTGVTNDEWKTAINSDD